MTPRRQITRQMRRQLERDNAKQPTTLTPVPTVQWPSNGTDPRRAAVYRSRDYLVQLFSEPGDILRLSVSRTQPRSDGHWQDGLTWDELDAIKRELGYGDSYAIEIYPRDEDRVTVANMRHLWVLPEPLAIGWFKGQPQ